MTIDADFYEMRLKQRSIPLTALAVVVPLVFSVRLFANACHWGLEGTHPALPKRLLRGRQ